MSLCMHVPPFDDKCNALLGAVSCPDSLTREKKGLVKRVFNCGTTMACCDTRTIALTVRLTLQFAYDS